MGEGGIRSQSRVPRNEEEEERAGGKERKERKHRRRGEPRAVREKRDRRQARLKHLKKREREREGAQEDKGRILMIKGRPHGKPKIQSLSPQLNSNQIQQ